MTGAVWNAGLEASGRESQCGGEPSLGKLISERREAMFGDDGHARWQESMAPELAHEFLAHHLVGEWKTTASMGEHANALSWTAIGRSILGGRCIEQRATGDWMGKPAESLMILGYDKVRRLFHLTAYDTMGTGVRTLWGGLDQSGAVLTFIGEMDEPMSGEIGKPFMTVFRFNDDGSYDYDINEILYGEVVILIHAHAERVK